MPGAKAVRFGLMPMVMIGALRQPSITSASGKPGWRVTPLSHGNEAAPGGGAASAGKFVAKSKVVYGP